MNKNGKERDNFYKKLEAEEYFKDLENWQGFGREAKFRDESMRLFRNKGNAKKVFTFATFSTEYQRVLYYLIHICGHLRALEVMKDSSWLYNNLNYQYHYEIYGYGFRTASYYQEHQLDLQFDINQDSETVCIKKLSKDINFLICKNPDGIEFKIICEKTMELNPATRKHYGMYFKFLQDANEIEVLRNGEIIKITENKKIRNSDIIRRSHKPALFDLKPFIQR